MLKFFRRHLYKLIPALLFSLSFLLLSGTSQDGSAVLSAQKLIVLWTDTISAEESARRLSSLCPDLILDEHLDNLSICQSTDSDLLSLQLQRLNEDPMIHIAEADSTVTPYYSIEDASRFDAQWAFHNAEDYIYYINDIPIHRTAIADIDINLPEAYEYLTKHPTNRTVTVAVIDTGIDINHPALKDHIKVNTAEIPDNGIDDDQNGYVDDIYGWDFYNNDNTVCHYLTSLLDSGSADPEDNDTHGTHCAGIIAATGNTFGVAGGIDIRILPLKIHGGPKGSGSIAQAIKAIKYAQAAGADICNLSWGTGTYSEALELTMRESDMLFVVAAGNSGGNNNSSPLYPASYTLDNMISVAYVNQSGELASDSNYGLSTVDIAAPGQDIYSTTVGGKYHYLSGTSMAAPVVSGVAALLYATNDSLYPQNIKETMLQTLKPLASLNGYIRHPGIVDAAAALRASEFLLPDTTAPTISAQMSYQEASLAVTLDVEDLGGSGLRVMRYAFGNLDASYFCNGTLGTPITDTTLYFNRDGIYTFYAADYAGNETTLSYVLSDDTTPPTISASYAMNLDGTFTVTATAEDTASGVKRFRYLEGIHNEQRFLALGLELPPEQGGSFTTTADTSYTFYVADYRGNKAIQYLEVKPIPAEQLFVNIAERTLQLGETYRLVPLMLPFTTTDHVSFAVNDETMLSIAPDGTLEALKPGTVTVTVSTTSGLTKECTIHIIEASS